MRHTILLAVLAAACSSPRTQVMVIVEAEPGIRADVRTLQIGVWGGRSPGELTMVVPGPQPVPARFPFQIPIVPRDNDASRAFRVEVTAIDAVDAPIGTVRAVSGFVAGQTLALRLTLRDSCRTILCTGIDTSCDGAVCVSASVDPTTLPQYMPPMVDAGPPPPTDGGAQCGNGLLEGTETCDQGDDNGAYMGLCNDTCSGPGPFCGDLMINPPFEECETDDLTICSTDCHLLVPRMCGDGRRDPGEACYGEIIVPVPGAVGNLQLELGDFDGDSQLDLMLAERTTGSLYFARGLGGGNFESLRDMPDVQPFMIAVADFEGDGRSELALTGGTDPALNCLFPPCLGIVSLDAAGGAVFYDSNLSYDSAGALTQIAIGDVDGDSRPELVIGYGNRVQTFRVGPGHDLIPMPETVLGGPGEVRQHWVGNAGGMAVLMMTLNGRDGLFVHLGGPDGTFDPFETFSFTPPWTVATFAVGNMIGGDAFMDAIALGGAPLTSNVIAGGFAPVPEPEVSWAPRNSSPLLHSLLVDVDGDGNLDLATTNFIDAAGSLGVFIALGDGAGHFLDPPVLQLPIPCDIVDGAQGDLNGDGVPDFVFSDCGSVVAFVANP